MSQSSTIKPSVTDAFSSKPEDFDPDASNTIEVDIRGLMLLLWRRKAMILGAVLIGMSITAIILSTITPMYSSKSLVLIETNAAQAYPKELEALFGKAKFDSSIMLNEIEVIRSRTLAKQVIDKYNLYTDSELNPNFEKFRPKSTEERRANFKSIQLSQDNLVTLENSELSGEMEKIITKFLKNLVVRSVPGSYAVYVEYFSESPQKSAFIANAIADTYIQQRLETKFAATQKVTDWLDKRLKELRTQVQQSESAVEHYKSDNGIVEGPRSIMTTEQLSELNQSLVSAKTAKAEAQAKLNQIEAMANNPSKIEAIPEIFKSNSIQRFKLNLSEQEAKMDELKTRYGPKHPIIKKQTSELKSLRGDLRKEILKAAESIKSELQVAKARVKSLEEGLDETSGENFNNQQAMVGLRALEREAQSTRLIFDTFLTTYKRSNNQEELQEPEARILSIASVPNRASKPNKLLILSLSATISLFIGLALAVLVEKLDNTYRSANQLESAMGFPCFGLIPHLTDKMTQKEVAKYVLNKPSSIVAEAVKTLRTVMSLKQGSKKSKVVTITSSFPSEGKTTLSTWVARLAAKSGEKVLIIDADLRRPSVHKNVGTSNELSIVDYLTGQKELEQVIQKDEVTGLHMLLGSAVPNSALDLVSSEKMGKLVKSLRKVYDLIVIDTPACLAVSDARVLAKMSDVTLYAVAWDQTPREVVMSGVKQFVDVDYDKIAFVLTNVDIGKHAMYGYGDTVYYYGRHGDYYHDS